MSDYWRVARNEARATSNDLVDSTVVKDLAYILRLSFLIQVRAKVVFLDHVYIDMFRKLRCGSVMGLMSSYICGVTLVEVLRFIDGLIKDQSLRDPIDHGVDFL